MFLCPEQLGRQGPRGVDYLGVFSPGVHLLTFSRKLVSIFCRSFSACPSRSFSQIHAMIRTPWVYQLDGEIISTTSLMHSSGDSRHLYSICRACQRCFVIAAGSRQGDFISNTPESPLSAAVLIRSSNFSMCSLGRLAASLLSILQMRIAAPAVPRGLRNVVRPSDSCVGIQPGGNSML